MLQGGERRRLAGTGQWISIVAGVEVIGPIFGEDGITDAKARQAVGLGQCAGDQQVGIFGY